MRIRLMKAVALAALAGPMLWIDTRLEACDTPVFQQALEAWAPDRFQVRVLHRGPLAVRDAALVETLRAGALDPSAPVNVDIGTVDVALATPEGEAGPAQSQPQGPLPRLVLRYPFRAAVGAPLWSSPLTEDSVRGLLDSPARREISGRIIRGDAIVFVLLGTGNAPVDRAAAGRLGQLLAEAKIAVEPLVQVEDLKLAFSMVRVSRSDPAEQVLVHALLRSEPDLERYADQPMVFPVFGRGRVLCALVGAGINAETVREVCAFLVGPCSCLVKAENPGFDLPMRADWEHVPGVRALVQEDPLPLVSIPRPEAADSTSALRDGRADGSSPESASAGGSGILANNVLLALAIIFAAAAVGSILLRRAGSRNGTNPGRGRRGNGGA